MRVLVVGAGAVGGYFGGRLHEAGRDVTFMVRQRRKEQLSDTGLVVVSPLGNLSLPAATILSSEVREAWDLIILSCKAYDLPGAIDSLAPAVGSQTLILPLLNGLSHLGVLEQRFGRERVLGGLCSIAVTADEDGRIIHLNQMDNLAFGELDGGDSPRVRRIAELMAPAKMQWKQSPDIIQEMWEKWVFLSALAASTCLMRATVGDIVSAGGAPTVAAMLSESQSVAAAAGHAARADVLERSRAMLTTPGSTLSASMLRDVEKGGRTEADHVIGDLIGRGRASGLVLPLLELAYLHLKSYEARHRREGGSS